MKQERKILRVDQDTPYNTIKKSALLNTTKIRQTKYIERMIENNLTKEELKILSEKGCTYASVTTSVLEQLFNYEIDNYDDKIFTDVFGFSLLVGENKIDCNILLCDIFATLYKQIEMNIHSYEVLYFDTVLEAAKEITKDETINDELKAMTKIFDYGYLADGIEHNKLKYKSKKVKNETFYGTYEQIAQEIFGINNITKEQFDELMKNNHKTYDVKYDTPESKFSGLGVDSIELWLNYYFKKKKINCNLNAKEIPTNCSYDEFMQMINNYIADGISIGISSKPGRETFITSSANIKVPVSSKGAGHAMNLVDIDENKIFVETWGSVFYIKAEEYQDYDFKTRNIEFFEPVNDVEYQR
ncbi:MAG: hypothetical protein ACK5HP_01185 [Bacilli bacterium]